MKLCLSIKTRLIIFALSISLIPIAVITVVHYIHAKNTLEQYIRDKLNAVAQSKKMHILCFMETKKIRTADFSTDGFIRNKLDQYIRNGNYNPHAAKQLNKYLSTHKLPLYNNLKAIVIVDVHGKVISSTSEHLYGRDMSDNEVFIQGKSRSYGETSTGQPHYNPYLDINCICVSAPVLSRQSGNLLGVIINMYSLTNVSEITRRNVGVGKTGEVYLVNRNKKMITESRFTGNAPLKQVVDTEPVRRIFEHGEEMVGIYKDYRGMEVIGVSLDIPEYGWIMLAEIDYIEAFAPLKTLGVVALILGILGSMVVTGVGILFSVSTSRPIKELTCATKRFAAGDREYRVGIARSDEIGGLAGSFNAMAEELSGEIKEHKRIEEELRKLNESLEQRVAERTLSLTRSNEALQGEITERRRVEEELRKFYNAVEQSPCTVIITGTKGNIEYVNPKFCHITGYSKEEVIGKNPRIMKSGMTPPEDYKRMWNAITNGKEWKGELYNRKKDGVLYWENTSIMPIKNSAGEITHFLAIKEDITERKHFVEQLSSLANHDHLTGLFNRRRFLDTFEERLEQARRYGTNGALLFLDLDNFKDINDTLGHQAGDEYLIKFARLLRQRIRKTDILARFGGDEFAILLSYVDADKAQVIASQIIESARQQISVANKKPTGVTVSIGIALFPQHSCIRETLLVSADQAMYRAKEEGRNRACMYTPGMDENRRGNARL